ncbi:MAG: hypothetical protein GEU26_06220 [Nitrososphaeraceae archaeon]|nr:hypothetical protein [Nitrososphaeraceae archaeon]
MKCGIFENNKLCFGLAIMTVAATVYPGYLGKIDLFAQTVPIVNNTATQQHTEHTFDNLIISEHIPLNGQLPEGDYILLMDFTPFATSVEGHSHIAMKVLCNVDGRPKINIVTGVAPKLNTLNIGDPINNGTLDGKDLDLSAEGRSCLYHAELPIGITDIALINTSNETLNFNEGGFSVTVSAHGTAIQHIGSNQIESP